MSDPGEKTAPASGPDLRPAGTRRVLYTGAAILDASGPVGSAMLLSWGERPFPVVLAAGSPSEVGAHPGAAGADRIDLPTSIILPGLINAHTHLDLTHIGPRSHDPDGGFLPWIDMIRANRRLDAAGVADSVRRGIALSLAGGTVAVGDIAGGLPGDAGLAAWNTLRESPLLGVCFLEVFGIGNRRQAGLDRLDAVSPHLAGADDGYVRLGIQPHAPYSVDRMVYSEAVRLARQHGAPLATHLAESPEEYGFVRDGRGPFRDLLERLGIWDETILEHIGRGRHPVRHLEPVLRDRSFLLAHVNDATDAALEVLAQTGATVAYCPRASMYFGAAARFGPHRYQEMLAAGVNVVLGTDSLVNLPDTPGRLSVWDEMCLLHRRDRTAPLTLLAMATVNSARALGLSESGFGIRPGSELAGAIAVPLPVEQGFVRSGDDHPVALLGLALRGGRPPHLLLARNHYHPTAPTSVHVPSTLPFHDERQMDPQQAMG